MVRDPYEVLGLNVDAGQDDIRRALRNLAQIYHPDRFDNANPGVLAEAMRRMQEVNAAYQALAGLEGQLVYWDTPEWSNRQRAELTEALLKAGIPHRWSDEELSVDRSYEDELDGLIRGE
jgi:DnaJ domain